MLPLTDGVLQIRFPAPGDEKHLVLFVERNIDYFRPSGVITLPRDLSPQHWRDFIAANEAERLAGTAMRFLVFHTDHGATPIAKIYYSQIFRGHFHACYLGYAMDHEFAGKGLMTKALGLTIEYMFDGLNLHRIMATYLPENGASGRVLEKLGFVIEGTAKDYLQINGVWRDHVLTSLTNPNWRTGTTHGHT